MPIACLIDPLVRPTAGEQAGNAHPDPVERESTQRQLRALLHTLAEHDIETFVIRADRPLGEQLVRGRRSLIGIAA
jgi:hypothetical protein